MTSPSLVSYELSTAAMSDEKSSLELQTSSPVPENQDATTDTTKIFPKFCQTNFKWLKSKHILMIFVILTIINSIFIVWIGFTQIYVHATLKTCATRAEVSEALTSVGSGAAASFTGPPGPVGPAGPQGVDGAPGPRGDPHLTP